ncbi:hypothetical protein LX32DRAFT_364506 [Colletotrichum zoysiae]|uniref:Uncharacterized protein n=1 Tax=Colletotrichum zoysiae TaxID=1216348 RepID=A0AAD9HJK2_9PEZI|nr:hypothetical protein LX32DRAFT_364506 [Colletotrichum zoysiae]
MAKARLRQTQLGKGGRGRTGRERRLARGGSRSCSRFIVLTFAVAESCFSASRSSCRTALGGKTEGLGRPRRRHRRRCECCMWGRAGPPLNHWTVGATAA